MDPAQSNLPSLSAFEATVESPSHNKTSLIVPLSSIESFTKEYEEINRKYRQEAMELDYRIRKELMEREKQHREESMRCVFKFFRGSQRVDSSTASSIIQSSPSVSNAIAPPSASKK